MKNKTTFTCEIVQEEEAKLKMCTKCKSKLNFVLGDWIQQSNKQGLIISNNHNWSNRKLTCEGQKRREEGTKPNSMYNLFNIFIELLFPLLLKLTFKELSFGFFLIIIYSIPFNPHFWNFFYLFYNHEGDRSH